ncbi:MAG: hypothetical protein C0601_08250 [Candidatus Muiribacterium halophilum]|uniref:SbsA Ig-like domain-containing protein n=1 Tax=Muiribacterium halophilum TaxID=2053465 RepID=A0A2N5ZEK8_MUIH1|nr:MAG: hypothetical protein C0601_08250 [Candidatus Muirbacterium halophilum]
MNRKILILWLILLVFTTTSFAEEDYRPGIIKYYPQDGAENIPVNTQITIEFSHQMDKASLNHSSISMYSEFGEEIKTALVFDDLGFRVYIRPVEELLLDTKYSIFLAAYIIKDINNKHLRKDFNFSFETNDIVKLKGEQKEPPKIVSIYPQREEEQIARDARILVGFNKEIKPSTINEYTLNLEDMLGNIIQGTYKYSHKLKKAVFLPSELLDYNHIYRVSITEGITDRYGNMLANPTTWKFKTVNPPDKTPPFVMNTSPADKSHSVALNSDITVTFNESINPVTINTLNVKLFNETDNYEEDIEIKYSPVANKLIIIPEKGLRYDKKYHVQISRAIKDMSDNNMLYDFKYYFSMESEGDVTNPSIKYTNPAPKEKGVDIGIKLKARFTESLDPTSINDENFRLYEITQGQKNKVEMMTVYNDKERLIVAIPSKKLEYNTEYIVEIENIRDLTGNFLDDVYSFKFRTEPEPDSIGPKVIGTTPANKDFKIPINSDIVIEFDEPVLSDTINNDTIFLFNETKKHQEYLTFEMKDSKVRKLVCKPMIDMGYFSRYTLKIGPEVADLSHNMMEDSFEIYFTTERNPDVKPPEVVNIIPAMNQTNIKIDSGITIYFSEALDEASVNPYSIFLYEDNEVVDCDLKWIAATNQVSVRPLKVLNYNKVYKVLISENVKDLARNSFDERSFFFTTMRPPDVVPPYILMTSPVESATNVDISAIITATFNEDIQLDTLKGNYYLTDGKDKIQCELNYDNITRKAMLEPVQKLKFNTTYTVYIDNKVKDLYGNEMEHEKVWNFHIEPEPDTIPPSVVYYEPANGRENVPINTKIKVKFSEPMAESTINEFSVLFSSKDEDRIDGIVNHIPEENCIEFYPSSHLDYATKYYFVVNNVIKDKAGNPMENAFKIEFTTVPAPDTTRPEITTTFPDKDQKDIPVDSDITVDFSEAMDGDSINRFTLFIKNEKTAETHNCQVTYDIDNKQAILHPRVNMDYFTGYMMTISRIVRDASGNHLKSTYLSRFRTEPAPDNKKPEVVNSFPGDKSKDFKVNDTLKVTFSEPMLEETITGRNIYLKDTHNEIIECALEYDETRLQVNIKPAYALEYEKDYSVVVDEVADVAGNTISAPVIISFRTENLPDMVPPRVVDHTPADLDTNVDIRPRIYVFFSEALNEKTLTTQNVLLETFTEQIDIKMFYDIRENRLEIVPQKPLDYKEEYKVVISSAISDLSGNQLDRTYIWRFWTQDPPDRIKPQIVSVKPKENSRNNDPNSKIMLQFSEKIKKYSINRYTFWIEDSNGDTLDFRVEYNGDLDRAVLYPKETLAMGSYRVNITEGIQDLAGNVLANPKSYNFIIGHGMEIKKPLVVVTNPENNSVNVSVFIDLSVTFNIPMDPTTINEYTFVVSDGVSRIPGKFIYNKFLYRVVFKPDKALSTDTLYNVTLTSGIKSAAGVKMENQKVYRFRTSSTK